MLTIQHNPFGDHHPYESTPNERRPRQPVAGDIVTVEATSTPAGAVQQLDLLVAINDGAAQQIAAERVAEEGEGTLWRATLPSAPAGDCVRYHFVANQGQVVSEPFEFTVADWQPVGAVKSWRRTLAGLHLTLADGLIVDISLRQPDQVQVRYTVEQAEAPITPAQAVAFSLHEGEAELVIATAKLHIVIQRAPYRLAVWRADGQPLFVEAATGGVRRLLRAGATEQLATSWQTPPAERFFGFGERFNAFDQRGQQIDTLVYEQYKNQDKRTYLPVPFFISSHGYGLFVNTAHRTHFDLAATHSEVATVAVASATLELILFVGEPKQVLPAFVNLVGKAALPPKWVFGLWMSSNEWNSQAQVLAQVALTQQHAIPASVLVIEAWSDEATFYLFNDAQYTPRPGNESFDLADFTFPAAGRWPDPKALIDALHEQGIRLLLWQIPVFKKLDAPHPQHDLDVAHALAHQLVLQNADGSPYRIRPLWFRDGFVPDFTNPALTRWWFDRRRYLIDELGVDGFKTDGGEHIWGETVTAADGSSGTALINRFPHFYEAAYARFAGDRRVLFSRAGYTGSQAVSTHWAGDENSTFAAFRASITAGLTAGASGFSFWGWDIGGFGGGLPTAELYLRATAMAAFCPIMQYHSEYNPERIECRDRTPWNVQAHTGDPQVIPIFRFFANLRMNLLPHIWSEAIKASRSGLPLLRALPIEFPHDQRMAEFPYQYLFGENLLIAPVAWEGCAELAVYLPAGDWYDFWTGARHRGSTVLRCAVPLDRIPVFVRAGSVVALHLPASLTLGDSVGNALDPQQNVIFRSYPATTQTRFTYYHDPAQPAQIFEIFPTEAPIER